MKSTSFKNNLKNNSGSVAILFAGIAAGAAILLGAAVELTRVNDVKSKLDSISDAASLAGKRAESETRADTATAHAAGEAAAIASFNANKAQLNGLASDIGLSLSWDSDNSLRATATAKANMVLGGVFGLRPGGSPISFINVSSVAVATQGTNQYIEIALVLDNTGSMFQRDGRPETRFTLLRNAVKSFVNTSFDSMTTPDRLRMAVVPFATTVNIKSEIPLGWDRSAGSNATIPDYGTRILPSTTIDRSGDIIQSPPTLASEFAPVGWRGCIAGDNESNTTIDDSVPSPSRWRALSIQPNMYNANWSPLQRISNTCYSCPPPPPTSPPPSPPSPPTSPPTSPPPPPTSPPPPPPPPPPSGMDGHYVPPKLRNNQYADFTKPMSKNFTFGKKQVQAGCTPYDCSYDTCNTSAQITLPLCNQPINKGYGSDPSTLGRRDTFYKTPTLCLDHAGCEWTAAPTRTEQPCVADPNEIAWNNAGGRWCAFVPATTWTQFDPAVGPNINCPMPMLGLSGSRPQILQTIDRMSPVGGGTHNDVGLRWGLRTLSPRNQWENFFGNNGKAPRNYGYANGKKAIILITDGQNQQANDFPGYWGCSDTAAPGCSGSPDRATLDTRMMQWCTTLRDTYKIELYTVAVNITDPTAVSLLATCAGNPAHAFAVDASQLNETLASVGKEIFALHLKE